MEKKQIYLIFKITRNNTFGYVVFNKKLLFWTTGGKCGFKNMRKKTFVASYTVGYNINQYLQTSGLAKEHFNVVFIGKKRVFRKSLFEGLHYKLRLHFASFKNITSIPFNGCRKKKKRRI